MNNNELDKWIAENVMGLVWRGCGCNSWFDPKNKMEISYNLSPTTDPAAAIKVLEKCAEMFPVEIRIGNYDKGRYFVGTDYDFDMTHGKAETLELAICLFAKKLFGKSERD